MWKIEMSPRQNTLDPRKPELLADSLALESRQALGPANLSQNPPRRPAAATTTQPHPKGVPRCPSCTMGRWGQRTRGAVSGWTHQPTSSSPLPAPSQAEEGEISSAARAPGVPPAPVPRCEGRPGPRGLAWDARLPPAMHYHLAPGLPCASNVPDYSNAGPMKEWKTLKEKEVIFQVKELCLMYCVI